MKKLNVTALALACGLTWGIFVFFVVLLTMFCGWGSAFTQLLGSVYIGVEGTLLGAFMGFLWAFVDGFIGGLVFVLLYNFFAKKFK